MSTRVQRNTSLTGDLTELEVALALTRAGYRVLRPMATACRYDLAIDNGDGTLTRIQCKTGLLKGGRIVFRVYSVSGHRSDGRSYQGQVDAFGVYCEGTRQTYLVPFALIPEHRVMVCLRVSPSKNGQRAGVHVADDFLISAGDPPLTPRPPDLTPDALDVRRNGDAKSATAIHARSGTAKSTR